MGAKENRAARRVAVDLISRLLEHRPNTLAGVAEDCPIREGQNLLQRNYADE